MDYWYFLPVDMPIIDHGVSGPDEGSQICDEANIEPASLVSKSTQTSPTDCDALVPGSGDQHMDNVQGKSAREVKITQAIDSITTRQTKLNKARTLYEERLINCRFELLVLRKR